MRGGRNLLSLSHTNTHIYILAHIYGTHILWYLTIYSCCVFVCSDENVPEAIEAPSARPSRRAKTAALDKTRQDLTALMNHEANA